MGILFRGNSAAWAAAAAVFVLLCSTPADAQDLGAARELYLQADFAAARDAFESTLTRPDLDRDAAVEAHRYLAALNLIEGHEQQAQAHVEAAVALAPDATPPEGSPPELDQLFETARQAGPATLRIEASADDPLRAGATATARAVLDAAPAALITSLLLACDPGGAPASAEGPPPEVELDLAIPDDAEALRCEAQARSEGGAPLITEQVDLPVQSASSGRRVWPWIVGAGGAAVLVAVIVAVAVVAADTPDDASLGEPRVEGW